MRRAWTFAIAALLLAACGAEADVPEAAPEPEPETIDVTVRVVASDAVAVVEQRKTNCTDLPGGLNRVKKGVQVTLRDKAGETVAVGELGRPLQPDNGLCIFDVALTDVPAGGEFYAAEVLGQESESLPESDVANKPVFLDFDPSA